MSRGPSQDSTPVRCTTIELKDLADTDEFDLNAEIGAIYGFEYTDSGIYKRREIDDKKVSKLEQLRNVTAEILGNYEYKIRRVDKNWELSPIIEWDIKFEFISPYTLFDVENKFRKSINSGPLHTSLVPESRGIIEVKPFKKQYSLHQIGEGDGGLVFVPEGQFADTFTLVLDISINDDSLNNEGKSKVVMDGLQINWTTLEKQMVTIVVQKTKDNLRGVSSNDKVDVSLLPSRLTKLKSINIDHFDLIGLHYIQTDLPDKVLAMFLKSRGFE